MRFAFLALHALALAVALALATAGPDPEPEAALDGARSQPPDPEEGPGDDDGSSVPVVDPAASASTSTSASTSCRNPKRCARRKDGSVKAPCCPGFACDRTGTRRCVAPTYRPGNLTVRTKGDKLLLSSGLRAKLVARSHQRVRLRDGTLSPEPFHPLPDAAATFPDPSSSSPDGEGGGWVYASNSEAPNGMGGAGSILFDGDGGAVGYARILSGTSRNCGGGRTPWGSWISCEENYGEGHIWQTDPFGNGTTAAVRTALGGEGKGGTYESFAYDDRTEVPTFYVTEDERDGALRRFTPNGEGMGCYTRSRDADRWCTLNHGSLDYLVLSGGEENGTYRWTESEEEGRESARRHFPHTEGIDRSGGTLYFVSKVLRRLVALNLDDGTYTWTSTLAGSFDSQPDQLARILRDDDGDGGGPGGTLYFAEDANPAVGCGVHGRDEDGRFFGVLDTPGWETETTGLAFSPDARHMYVALQQPGLLFDVTRRDGLPFDASVLDIRYHGEKKR